MKETEKSIFEERYRVVSVESDRLLVRGVLSGEMLTIINPEPETPLTQEDYPRDSAWAWYSTAEPRSSLCL
jgi:hypothetical protein